MIINTYSIKENELDLQINIHKDDETSLIEIEICNGFESIFINSSELDELINILEHVQDNMDSDESKVSTC